MKIAITGDLHLRNSIERPYLLQEGLNILNQVEEHADVVLFTGDLFDERYKVSVNILNRAAYHFKKTKTPYYAISGNHDQNSINAVHNPSDSILHMLDKTCDNFNLMDCETKDLNSDIHIAGVEYYHKKDDFHLALDQCVEVNKEAKLNILLIHQTPICDNIPFGGDCDVNKVLDAGFDYVFCGHYHNRVEVCDKFYLVGNPYHLTQSDVKYQKGYYLLDTDSNELNFVPTTYTPLQPIERNTRDLQALPVEVKGEDLQVNFDAYCESKVRDDKVIEIGKDILNRSL